AFGGPAPAPERAARCDGLRAVPDLEVQHRPPPVVADGADALAGAELLADLDVHFVEVAAHRVVVVAVVDDDDAAVRPISVGEGDATTEDGANDGAHGRVDLQPGAVGSFTMRRANLRADDD